MGARGPAKTPTAILKIHGSRLVKDRKGEPSPPRGKPPAPDKFTDAQKEIWTRLIRELDGMAVLTRIDHWSLRRYCVYFDRWIQCEDMINRLTITNTLLADNEDLNLSRLHKESLNLNKALKEIEDRFGLNPAARARLTSSAAGEDKPATPFEALMRGRKKA